MQPKLSDHQRALLAECAEFKIAVINGRYLRLGGSGESPLRYNDRTLYILRDMGAVSYDGYWQATEKGRAILAESRAAISSMSTPTITKISIVTRPDTDSYAVCRDYLGEFSAKTGEGYYLDRMKGEFRGPYVPWEQASPSVRADFTARAVREDGSEQAAANGDALGQALYEDEGPGELLASKCSREGDHRSLEYLVPAQHLPHNPENWQHVRDRDPAEIGRCFASMVAEGKFAEFGIEPQVTPQRPQEFWLDVLYAVQDCERVESHERGDWQHHTTQVVAELEMKGEKGHAYTAKIESTMIGGTDVDLASSSVPMPTRVSMLSDHIGEVVSQLLEHGISEEAINAAITEHLGPEFLPQPTQAALPTAASKPPRASR